jgi:hypothetical protein
MWTVRQNLEHVQGICKSHDTAVVHALSQLEHAVAALWLMLLHSAAFAAATDASTAVVAATATAIATASASAATAAAACTSDRSR